MKRKIFTAGAIALFFLCVPLFFFIDGLYFAGPIFGYILCRARSHVF